ncbi:MAG: MBL fold metallo-hydrolase [Promethearchaeota archaeon]
MKITWIAHSCFKIELENKVIYIDPYEISKKDKADILLATHDHYDHFDEGSASKVIDDNTLIIAPASCKKVLSKYKNSKGLKPGDTIDIENIKIEAVRAYNPEKHFHPKSNNWLGYIINGENYRIYHAGDTDRIPEMKELKDIDFALLPVGDTYTMGFGEAIDAAKDIMPKRLIPMHSWDKDLNQFKKLGNKILGDKVEILVLEKGKEYTF